MTSTGVALELLWSSHQRCPTGMATLRRRTEDREAAYRLWWDGTRRRIEADEPREVLVVDGRQWWQETGDVVTVGDGQWYGPPPAADDAVRDFVRNLGWFDIEIRGAVDHAGRHCVDLELAASGGPLRGKDPSGRVAREALTLEARPRRTPVWASRRRHGRTSPVGDEYLVLIDDEFGLVTRLEARVGGHAVDVTELVDLRCGQALPGELFADPPEHRRRRTVHEAYAAEEESVSLAEAIRRAGFTVVVPAGLSCETFPVLVVLRHHESGSTTVSITYRRPGGRAFAIHQGPSADPVVFEVSQWQPQGGHPPRWVETSPVGSTPRVALLTESSGTAAMIFGDTREDLAALAQSLVPALTLDDGEREPG